MEDYGLLKLVSIEYLANALLDCPNDSDKMLILITHRIGLEPSPPSVAQVWAIFTLLIKISENGLTLTECFGKLAKSCFSFL
jgi:hypothetical protein